jgi:FAD dependent oxidoreductase TIGR03364
MEQRTAIVIGAGIVGLAMARSLAIKGYSVKVIERNHKAVGASIRNFGMIWPIGQPSGDLYERALRSKSIWQSVCNEANIWYNNSGSVHLAHNEDEWIVLKELYEAFYKERPVQLLTKAATEQVCPAAETTALYGSLYSKDEMIINAVNAIAVLPDYLAEKYAVKFIWGKCASYIADNTVYVGTDETYEADMIFICSGTDFETLFPTAFAFNNTAR